MNKLERKINKHSNWGKYPGDRQEELVYKTERDWLWKNVFDGLVIGKLYIMRVTGSSTAITPAFKPPPYNVLLRTKTGHEIMGNNLLVMPIDYSEQWKLKGSMVTSGNCLTVLCGGQMLYFRASKRWVDQRNFKFVPLTEENAHEVQEPDSF